MTRKEFYNKKITIEKDFLFFDRFSWRISEIKSLYKVKFKRFGKREPICTNDLLSRLHHFLTDKKYDWKIRTDRFASLRFASLRLPMLIVYVSEQKYTIEFRSYEDMDAFYEVLMKKVMNDDYKNP
jgi:hypothetical protein